jgi:hypothetical protein
MLKEKEELLPGCLQGVIPMWLGEIYISIWFSDCA